ncbi:MAG TPA: hypothetical protein V6D17_08475 [Candidatus Obscuribacterales bacterium]
MQNTATWREQVMFKFQWPLGWKIDIPFMLLPNLIAFVLYLALVNNPFWMDNFTRLVMIVYAGNVIHQGATWFHFFDKRNSDYYFGSPYRNMQFAIIPPVILLLSLAAGYVYPQLVMLVYMCWTVPHFVQQNVGILMLYHNHGQNEAIVSRNLEVRSQQVAGLFFSMLMIDRLSLHETAVGPLWTALIAAVFVILAVMVFAYFMQLFSQVRKGAYINVPALLFWLASILFFVPFAYMGKQFLVAAVVPSLLHFIQYIALHYVLVKRKYADGDRKVDIPTANPMLFLVCLIGAVFLVQYGSYLVANLCVTDAKALSFLTCGFLGLGMVHYWIDGLIWKFRDPFIRNNTLPFIVRPKTAA